LKLIHRPARQSVSEIRLLNQIPLEHDLVNGLEQPWSQCRVNPHCGINDTACDEIDRVITPRSPLLREPRVEMMHDGAGHWNTHKRQPSRDRAQGARAFALNRDVDGPIPRRAQNM
jgi:hypothetical protein